MPKKPKPKVEDAPQKKKFSPGEYSREEYQSTRAEKARIKLVVFQTSQKLTKSTPWGGVEN